MADPRFEQRVVLKEESLPMAEGGKLLFRVTAVPGSDGLPPSDLRREKPLWEVPDSDDERAAARAAAAQDAGAGSAPSSSAAADGQGATVKEAPDSAAEEKEPLAELQPLALEDAERTLPAASAGSGVPPAPASLEDEMARAARVRDVPFMEGYEAVLAHQIPAKEFGAFFRAVACERRGEDEGGPYRYALKCGWPRAAIVTVMDAVRRDLDCFDDNVIWSGSPEALALQPALEALKDQRRKGVSPLGKGHNPWAGLEAPGASAGPARGGLTGTRAAEPKAKGEKVEPDARMDDVQSEKAPASASAGAAAPAAPAAAPSPAARPVPAAGAAAAPGAPAAPAEVPAPPPRAAKGEAKGPGKGKKGKDKDSRARSQQREGHGERRRTRSSRREASRTQREEGGAVTRAPSEGAREPQPQGVRPERPVTEGPLWRYPQRATEAEDWAPMPAGYFNVTREQYAEGARKSRKRNLRSGATREENVRERLHWFDRVMAQGRRDGRPPSVLDVPTQSPVALYRALDMGEWVSDLLVPEIGWEEGRSLVENLQRLGLNRHWNAFADARGIDRNPALDGLDDFQAFAQGLADRGVDFHPPPEWVAFVPPPPLRPAPRGSVAAALPVVRNQPEGPSRSSPGAEASSGTRQDRRARRAQSSSGRWLGEGRGESTDEEEVEPRAAARLRGWRDADDLARLPSGASTPRSEGSAEEYLHGRPRVYGARWAADWYREVEENPRVPLRVVPGSDADLYLAANGEPLACFAYREACPEGADVWRGPVLLGFPSERGAVWRDTPLAEHPDLRDLSPIAMDPDRRAVLSKRMLKLLRWAVIRADSRVCSCREHLLTGWVIQEPGVLDAKGREAGRWAAPVSLLATLIGCVERELLEVVLTEMTDRRNDPSLVVPPEMLLGEAGSLVPRFRLCLSMQRVLCVCLTHADARNPRVNGGEGTTRAALAARAEQSRSDR